MLDLESKLDNMESDFNSLGSGRCFLIKLLNYDELYATSGTPLEIVSDLNIIVRKIFSETADSVFTQILRSGIFVITSALDGVALKKSVKEIHEASQLYTNESAPEAYMEIKIGSMEFGSKNKGKAESVYLSLVGLLACNRREEYYYYEYREESHNLGLIKRSNEEINSLRKALKEGKLKFAYQPVIDKKTGKASYHECLLRKENPDGSLTPLGALICKAESKGLLYPLDRVVFEMAVKELASSDPDLNLSVNVSNIGILDDNLLDFCLSLLERYKVSERLIIEITESSLNKDYEKTKKFMDALHKKGCRFALDDFGAGFTTFRQLESLPIDIIKIDGYYIRNILENKSSRYFVEALIKISEEKGIKTVAEFVENGDIAKYLIDKVDGMQGNFFSPAVGVRKDS